MPTKAVQQFLAWSYSRLHDYEECPLKAKLKHLDKVKEPGSPAMERGSTIHKLAEQYATGLLSKLPEELKLFAAEFKALRKLKQSLSTEQQLAVDRRWHVAEWFGAGAWCRAVIDCFYVEKSGKRAKVIDYKTGKVREENDQQLDLYAPVMLAHLPESVETIEAELWYLDQGHVSPKSYTRDEAKLTIPAWEKRTKKLLSDKTFKPTPSDACRWCHYGQNSKRTKCGPGLCKF